MSAPRSKRESALLAVYDGHQCIGHLIRRGREGIEAFDRNDRSLGLYPDEATAANAITIKAGEP